MLELVAEGGFLGFELGADGAGGGELHFPGSGSRIPAEGEKRFLTMNGREVFKFATRVLVTSAEAILETCALTVADVDVYVPHQANVRIIDHAVRKLGFPGEKVVVNVDRCREYFVWVDPARTCRRDRRRPLVRPEPLF